MKNQELKPCPGAYAISEPIYINIGKVPEDYNEHIVKEMLLKAAIQEGTEICKPFFCNVAIIEQAVTDQGADISFRIIEEVKGKWSAETYMILYKLLGGDAVSIGMTGISLEAAIEDKKEHLKELKNIFYGYEEVFESILAFTMYGFTEEEAITIMRLQALREIASGMTDIVRELIDENAEKILQAIR